jgi:quercetin dioxygenase-like cupin family protein
MECSIGHGDKYTFIVATIQTAGNRPMDIKRVDSQPSTTRPAEWFTCIVRIDSLFQAHDPARVQGASVTFEPGVRTAWHTHPLSQILIVTAGCGWVQRDGGSVEEIRPGDVAWFPPGEKHRHGATPTTTMTHIAIQEKLDGKVVDWMDPTEPIKRPSQWTRAHYGTTRTSVTLPSADFPRKYPVSVPAPESARNVLRPAEAERVLVAAT